MTDAPSSNDPAEPRVTGPRRTGPLRTGLVVPVPEAEELVGSWRLDHDPSAANGAPAHVTLLFPFRPLEHVDTTIGDLRTIFGSVPRRPVRLTHVGVFPRVVWLAPEPASVFIELTERLVAHFPDCQPYGGAYELVIPHLTVIDHSGREGSPDGVRDSFIARADAALPIEAELSEVILLAEDDAGRWSTHTTFPLG
jgi:2'-5' RNA ligase